MAGGFQPSDALHRPGVIRLARAVLGLKMSDPLVLAVEENLEFVPGILAALAALAAGRPQEFDDSRDRGGNDGRERRANSGPSD